MFNLQNKSQVSESSVVINSILQGEVTVGPKTTASHCCFQGKIVLGKESIIAGLRIEDFKVNWILAFNKNKFFNMSSNLKKKHAYVILIFVIILNDH